jgi:hypothetical protein
VSYYYDFVLPCEKREKKGNLRRIKKTIIFARSLLRLLSRPADFHSSVGNHRELHVDVCLPFSTVFVAGLVPHLYFPIILQMSESVTSLFVQKLRST